MEVSVSKERRNGRGRWSAKRKTAAVLRLLRGEDIETLSRELGVTAAMLCGWREQFLASGTAGLRAREADGVDEETQRLKSLVADLSMRAATRKNPPHGSWTPFGLAEVDELPLIRQVGSSELGQLQAFGFRR